MNSLTSNFDVIVVGAGLAGLVATYELTLAGKSVLVIDQENRANLGGQAFWSLGGLFFVNSPEQRRMGIKDSVELAWQDWQGSAGFDRDREDFWPRQWARAYVDFAANEKRDYLRNLGLRVIPTVGWAERGAGMARGHGNSIPRFHLTWGTGPEVVRVFAEPVLAAEKAGLVTFAFRHQVDELIVHREAADSARAKTKVTGVKGSVLVASDTPRGVKSSREIIDTFEFSAPAVIITSGGIGGNLQLVQDNWPSSMGRTPEKMICGVPAHVDGRMIEISKAAGANVVNADRMWHYTEGIKNFDPIWPEHAIRIIPGPSALWLDAQGKRLPFPCLPGFDSRATLEHIANTGYDYSWFILTQAIIEKEFALSGSEQNPDLTSKSIISVLNRIRKGAPAPVEAFKNHGVDFAVADNLAELVNKMNEITGESILTYSTVAEEVSARDREIANPYSKDAQITAIHGARTYRADKITRIATPHRLEDPKFGPLIAVRLHLVTRKTLGGIETNLDSQVIQSDGSVLDGLYAAGEVAGFGGGGVHGYNALEGTFLGGCIFSGRAAGKALAKLL